MFIARGRVPCTKWAGCVVCHLFRNLWINLLSSYRRHVPSYGIVPPDLVYYTSFRPFLIYISCHRVSYSPRRPFHLHSRKFLCPGGGWRNLRDREMESLIRDHLSCVLNGRINQDTRNICDQGLVNSNL